MSPAAKPRRLAHQDLVPLEAVRTHLSVLWLCGGGAILLLVVAQSLFGRYGARTQDAWQWLLPNLLPTLGLIVTAAGYTALDPVRSAGVVRKLFYRIAALLSALYLLLVFLTVAVQPFAAYDADKAVELMRTSNLWLGPLQGLTASALGVLFASKRENGPVNPVEPSPSR